MQEDFINMIIKALVLNLYTYFVSLKNIEHKDIKRMQLVISSVLTTVIYVITKYYMKDNSFIATIVTFIIQLLFLMWIIKNNHISLIVINFISNAIVNIAFGISILIEIPVQILLHIDNAFANILIILSITTILLFFFFNMNRFKNGLAFLKKQNHNDYLDIVIINISAVVLLAFCLLGSSDEKLMDNLLFSFVILSIIMIIMIQKTLTLHYKQKLLARTIEDYKLEISNKDKEIEKLSKEKYKISKLNHEFYNRQKALELKVQEFVNNTKLEIGQDLSVTKQIENLSKEYSNKLTEIKGPDKLPSTDIEEIDDMFKYMQSECSKNGIIFNLQVTDNIHYMINNIIEQDKLVTLIGDHIRDAIIAVSNSENKFKSIIAILGRKDNCYEFCVYDTGIEFEIDTLLKLGIEPATTHKDTGGTGIGFMTTFETMKETKASLIISENKPANDDYTKSVAIRFDNKNEYRICSYRANQIKEKDTNNRIIIENKSIAK